MAFDRPHYYLTFGGTLFPLSSNPEEWQSGLHFAGGPNFTVQDYEDALEAISLVDILGDLTAMISGATGSVVDWSYAVTAQWAKIAVIGTDGKYAAAPKMAEQTPVGGATQGGVNAPQLAACVSLWSGDNFGRGNRGRSYMPVPYTMALSITPSEPRATVAQANGLRDVFKIFVNDVEGEVTTVLLPVSAVIMSSLGAGVTKPIMQISCGRVIDTMRSRRQALEEEKVWAPM